MPQARKAYEIVYDKTKPEVNRTQTNREAIKVDGDNNAVKYPRQVSKDIPPSISIRIHVNPVNDNSTLRNSESMKSMTSMTDASVVQYILVMDIL